MTIMLKRRFISIVLVLAAGLIQAFAGAAKHDGPALRRPISPSSPAWIIHIDVWNSADPQKIIDLVPEDIRPYVIFNISTSATDATSHDGPAVYDSWMKVCAQNRVWTMIQCSSGAHNRMPDNDVTAYRKYFEEYPNFLGYNFAEQFWDFGAEKDDGSGEKWPTFPERLQLFADLMPICHEFGGYLTVSFTQAYYSADMMPIAFMKRNEQMRKFLTADPEHFICCEKYTMKNGFFDIESNCLGAYLGGYAGQYGIRFDACGWVDGDNGSHFVKAAGAIPIMEHVMLTGQTVIDGPETIPVEVSHELPALVSSGGYTARQWGWFPHFVNINIDGFRKILDGTVRIMTRREVIDRTKICVLNNIPVTTTDDPAHNPYLTPERLFDGLYRQDCDQGGKKWRNHWLENQWWLKKTGRYPAIPQVYTLIDDDARTMEIVHKSKYNERWGNVDTKVKELNELFPEEYTGDIYAGRHENGWVTYNPYQYDETVGDAVTEDGQTWRPRTYAPTVRRACGVIPFKYNTCDSIALSYAPYGMGVMREYADNITLYLTNYRNDKVNEYTYTEHENVADTIRVYGAVAEPVVEWKDRGEHRKSTVKTTWEDGVLTVEVLHNGPLDMTIRCAGTATGRLTDYTPAVIEKPEQPEAYTGQLQYEAEHFAYKDIATCHNNGYWTGQRGYCGLGFVNFGTKSTAAITYSAKIETAGKYRVTLRYKSTSPNKNILYVKVGAKRMSLTLDKETEDWTESSLDMDVKAGTVPILIQRSTSSSLDEVLIDCVKLDLIEVNSIENMAADGIAPRVVKTEYYDIAGHRLERPGTGLTIVRKHYADGTVRTDKTIM